MKFVTNLLTLNSPLHPLSNLKSANHWNNSNTKAFEELKNQIVNTTENNHFDIRRKTRLKTDASQNDLRATFEQGYGAFALRFLNSHEMKNSIYELELLRMVCATERFKKSQNGSDFEIVTDHKALLSALNANHTNKTIQNQTYPREKKGFIEILSRLPSRKALSTSHYENEFVLATLNKILENLIVNSDFKKKNCSRND